MEKWVELHTLNAHCSLSTETLTTLVQQDSTLVRQENGTTFYDLETIKTGHVAVQEYMTTTTTTTEEISYEKVYSTWLAKR